MNKACFHLPGLFEFYELYRLFLPLWRSHPEYFYDHCRIASIYGAPGDCLWGGGRIGYGNDDPRDVFALTDEYGISARLTFSNSLLREEHLGDRRCLALCEGLSRCREKGGVIVHSDCLARFLGEKFPSLSLISSTTKVLTDFEDFRRELGREEFRFVVPDFRLNREFEKFNALEQPLKDKTEFLVNECCYFGCADRKACYENVSRKALGEDVPDHICRAPGHETGYRFSKAMANPGFISARDIADIYLPMGFTQFKIEGRSLGSAMVLEFLLYYLVRPEYTLHVREAIYLDSMLDLF